MFVLLLNPPHTAIGSRVPDDHLPPLGLLALGGPLRDAGHRVELLDADRVNMTLNDIVDEVCRRRPDALLVGHSGSTSAHPTVVDVTGMIRARLPSTLIIYGGLFPTYHWRQVLQEAPHIDIIVRGEGEATCVRLLNALAGNARLDDVAGIAFRANGTPKATPPATMIQDLDAHRVGWELIDHSQYSYWGGKRAVVIQFSRGCPHACTYCGQRGFWTRWRHRDPIALAAEIAGLHRKHGVQVFNLADENPTSSRRAWRAFLEAIIAEGIHIEIVGSTRAGDIVRDADILHLYRKAGVVRFLMGTESTDEATLDRVKKGSTAAVDREAIRLLRVHGIQSLATWVVGFEEERLGDYLRGLRRLLRNDPDQIQLLYVTPHRWTAYYSEASSRRVIQLDRRLWDYKHQVLATRHLPPWVVMLSVKTMESVLQLRPRALWRALTGFDPEFRASMRWYYRVGRRVWFYEWVRYLFREQRTSVGPTLSEMWGPPQVSEELPLAIPQRQHRPRPGHTASFTRGSLPVLGS